MGGIGMMGNAVGFPLCVGLGMVTGAVVGYISDPKSNLELLVPGISVPLCGIFAVGFLSYRKEKELAEKATKAESSAEYLVVQSGSESELSTSESEVIDDEEPGM